MEREAKNSPSRYAFASTSFPDYPKFSLWPDADYATFSRFHDNTFLGAQVCAYDHTNMLSGASVTQQCFTTKGKGRIMEKAGMKRVKSRLK